MTDEPFIMTSTDDAWETLDEGESLLVKGKLEHVSKGRGTGILAPAITISFADWSQAVLEIENYEALRPIPLSTQVTVRAVISEASACHLKAVAIWTSNSVPIPC